ncbi:MAG: DUF1616 domain-containing protein [Candidatus Bathyarchaeia archaeon]
MKKSSNIDKKIIQIINEKKPKNVEQLLTLAKEELIIPEQDLLKIIIKMQSEEKITFKKQILPTFNFTAYLKTEQAYWYWATIITSTITTLAVFLIPENLHPWIYIRYALGIMFVLWLPGYTFVKMLFPGLPSKASEKTLDTIERTALSLGMSIALVPMIGLLLNYTPWGIRLTPIVLSLLTLTVAFATAALLREYYISKAFRPKIVLVKRSPSYTST